MKSTIMHFRNMVDICQEKGLARALRFDWYRTLDRWIFPYLYPKQESWEALCKNRRSHWKGLLVYYTPRELYDTLSASVRKGIAVDIDGQQLKEIAKDYGFSLELVEESIKIGDGAYYEKKILELRRNFETGAIGMSHQYDERKLRDLASKYDLPIAPLEEALKLYDPRKEAATHLVAADIGFTGNRLEAERLAQKYGFSLEEIGGE